MTGTLLIGIQLHTTHVLCAQHDTNTDVRPLDVPGFTFKDKPLSTLLHRLPKQQLLFALDIL